MAVCGWPTARVRRAPFEWSSRYGIACPGGRVLLFLYGLCLLHIRPRHGYASAQSGWRSSWHGGFMRRSLPSFCLVESETHAARRKMMIRPADTRATAVVVMLFMCLTPTLLSGRHDCCDGHSWLKWKAERRDTYVGAYIEGYYEGYIHGCQEGTKGAPPPPPDGFDNQPINKCLDRKWNFAKGIDLSADVTEFYKRYPENRNMLIKVVLDELGKGRSLEEIHRTPPFPYQKPSKDAEASGRK